MAFGADVPTFQEMQKSQNTAEWKSPLLRHSCNSVPTTSNQRVSGHTPLYPGGPMAPVPEIRPSNVPRPPVLPLLDLSLLKASNKSQKGLVEMNELTEIDDKFFDFETLALWSNKHGQWTGCGDSACLISELALASSHNVYSLHCMHYFLL